VHTKSRRSDGYTGELNLRPNQTKGSLRYMRPFLIDLTTDVVQDVLLELEVLDNREENAGNFTLIGQIEVFW
jgi:hypothetical protein